jgi:hypothetical protein
MTLLCHLSTTAELIKAGATMGFYLAVYHSDIGLAQAFCYTPEPAF